MKSLLALLLAAQISFSLHAKDSSTLVMGLSNIDYPPFYYVNEKKELVGLSLEICEELLSKLERKFITKRVPFSRMLANIASGKYDISCTLFNTKDRAPRVIYTSIPHAVEETVIFAHKDTSHHIRVPTQSSIKDEQIAGIQSYYYGPHVGEEEGYRLLRVQNEDQLIDVILAKRIKYALGNPHAIKKIAKEKGVLEQLIFINTPVYEGPLYIGVSRERKDAHELISELTKELYRFRQTEKYSQILKKYGAKAPKF